VSKQEGTSTLCVPVRATQRFMTDSEWRLRFHGGAIPTDETDFIKKNTRFGPHTSRHKVVGGGGQSQHFAAGKGRRKREQGNARWARVRQGGPWAKKLGFVSKVVEHAKCGGEVRKSCLRGRKKAKKENWRRGKRL